MSTTPDGPEDVIELLSRQHKTATALFSEVKMSTGADKRAAFERLVRLVRLLAVHETAEEEVVHPAARGVCGDQVVDSRLAEEHEAKQMLSELDRMGPDAEGFDELLERLRLTVAEHSLHEEELEFPALREQLGRGRLVAMAAGVRAAEALAPTHPHPGVEGALQNVLVGTPVAMMDRARDAIRKATGNSTVGTDGRRD